MNKIRMKNRRVLSYFLILKDKEILFNGQELQGTVILWSFPSRDGNYLYEIDINMKQT